MAIVLIPHAEHEEYGLQEETPTVDSFSIACTTCQTQLRVRDRSAIGQILTCPKCGSMVSGGAARGDTRFGDRLKPHGSAAVAKGAGGQWQRGRLAGRSSGVVRHRRRPVAIRTHGRFAGRRTTRRGNRALCAVVETVAVPDASLPTEDWRSASSATWRPWLLTGCAAVAGVGLAIAVFSWLSRDDARRLHPSRQ